MKGEPNIAGGDAHRYRPGKEDDFASIVPPVALQRENEGSLCVRA
jgi:hypothetical protein